MGLDWHSSGTKRRSKCRIVGAPKGKEVPDYLHEVCRKRLEYHKEMSAKNNENDPYRKYWQEMTLEKLIQENAEKYVCEKCPLLRALNDADQTGSLFLGITCSSCDLRGKAVVSALEELNDEEADAMIDECYEEHDRYQMLDFALRLENLKRKHEEAGTFDLEPYDEYLARVKPEWDEYAKGLFEKEKPDKDFDVFNHELMDRAREDVFWFGPRPPMTPAMYANHCDWRRVWLQKAIHWLRTTAKFGLTMKTSW
ncbi:MAG: hypothetical protein K6T65_05475 [Peptococcaceae bacterium]|nr:hypothetical protein [Peptococcaceae bacterium]